MRREVTAGCHGEGKGEGAGKGGDLLHLLPAVVRYAAASPVFCRACGCGGASGSRDFLKPGKGVKKSLIYYYFILFMGMYTYVSETKLNFYFADC